MRTLMLSLAAPVFLAACATSDAPEDRPRGVERYAGDPRLGEEVSSICFASTIDGFGETTRDTVVVRDGRDHYLIAVFGACTPLDDAMRIGMDATGSCLRKHDALIVSDSISDFAETTPFSKQRCLVNGIYAWNPEAKAEKSEEESEKEDAES